MSKTPACSSSVLGAGPHNSKKERQRKKGNSTARKTSSLEVLAVSNRNWDWERRWVFDACVFTSSMCGSGVGEFIAENLLAKQDVCCACAWCSTLHPEQSIFGWRDIAKRNLPETTQQYCRCIVNSSNYFHWPRFASRIINIPTIRYKSVWLPAVRI